MKNKPVKIPLKQLEAKLKVQQNLTRDLLNTVHEARRQKTLPGLKKQYEGKYFKYKNSTGTDKGWYIYLHVISVEHEHEFKGVVFEIAPEDTYCGFKYRVETEVSRNLCNTEISNEEYSLAKEKFIISLAKIFDIRELQYELIS